MALVQSKSTHVAADKTISVVLDSAITSGNLLIAVWTSHVVNLNATWAVSSSSGAFTTAIDEVPSADFGPGAGIAYRQAGGSESTTINLVCTSAASTPDQELWVGEYSGLLTSGVLDQVASVAMINSADNRLSQSSGTSGALAQNEELAIAAWGNHQVTTGDSYSGSFTQVAKVSGASYSQMIIASFASTSTGAVSCTLSWTSPSTICTGVLATFKFIAGTDPINTIPGDGTQTTSSTTTPITGVMVSDGTSSVDTVQMSCTSGDLTVTLSGSVTIGAGANGSSNLTITGDTTANKNTVLGTLVYQGDAAFHGKDTITVLTTDTVAATDSDAFYVLNDPHTLTLTGAHANLVAAIGTNLEVTMHSGTTGTVTIVATDAAAAFDTGVVDLVLSGVDAVPPPPIITSNGGGPTASINVVTGITYVTTVVASDPQILPITYSISGGVDQALFEINGNSGALRFLVAASYGTPTDSDTDGIYLVTVRASNGTTYDEQALTITVTMKADAGPDQTVQAGSLVQLDGSSPDSYATVIWEFLSVPVGSLAVLSSSSIINPTFFSDLAGTYSLKFTIFDGASPQSTVSDTMLVTVAELVSLVPMFIAASRAPTVPGDKRAGVALNAALASVWKYPKDLYDVAVDWSGPQVLPSGAAALGALTVTVLDLTLGSPNDVSSTLIAGYGASPVTGWGTDGLVSWVTLTGGTIGKTYTVTFSQTFDNGQIREKYVELVIRKPRKYATKLITKYPSDKFPVPIQWAGREPRGATALNLLTTMAFDPTEVDETSTYIAGSFVAGTVGACYLLGGTGGESRLLEFAQEFDNGRIFHEYVTLTVEVPPTT